MEKILLVDDHPLTRLVISQILTQQDASYNILEASKYPSIGAGGCLSGAIPGEAGG